MPRQFEPQPLPKDDVKRIYDCIAQSSVPLTLDSLAPQFPEYTKQALYWACGVLVRQGILSLGKVARSDRSQDQPHFNIKLPFDENYIGWEAAK